MLMASMTATAQETYQDAKLAAGQLTGTARYVGMGGAMEALGADISTISTNPAGVGLLRKSQVSISAGVIAQSGAENYTEYEGSRIKFDGKKSHPTFDQVGVVWSPNSKGRSYLNLSFNYHKETDFGQILNAANTLNKASQNKLTAGKYLNGDYGWSCLDANYGGSISGNTYYPGLLGNRENELAYTEANRFLFGQYQHGYIGEYDFNISGSIKNRVWLGLTVGIHDVHYHSNSMYSEDLTDGNISDSYEEMKISGTGFDIKAGIIFRPVETSPFRIGVYVNSPVFYDLTLRSASDVLMYGENSPQTFVGEDGKTYPYYTKESSATSADYGFRLDTPWKLGVSLGHTVGNFLALGATYEYAWYDHMDNRVKNAGYYDYYGDYYETSSSDKAMNADTRANLKGVSLLKLGVEAKPVTNFAIRVGYNYVSPMYKNNAVRDLTIDSNGVYSATSADYTNWKATHRVTFGLGYSYRSLSIDLAYQCSMQKGDFYPFQEYNIKGRPEYTNVASATEVKNNRHQLLMTVGYKF